MDKNPNIFRKLASKQVNSENISFDRETDPCNTPIGSSRYLISTGTNNGTNSGTDSDEYVRDPSSILSLQPWIFKRDKQQMSQNPNLNNSNSNSETPSTSIYKNSLRTRRGHRNLIKPISIENCLIPQLYNEDFKFDEHVFGPVKTRPFVVINGDSNRIISENSACEISCLREKRKGKRKSLDLVDENGNLRSSKLSNSQAHSPSPESKSNKNNDNNNKNQIFVLSIGICIGVVSSILCNKNEVDKLNDKLKSTENLVQDLQDELEMKDSLTVKELLPLELEEPSRSFVVPQEEEDESQSMSKIEAELEAELERLELNITSSTFQGRPSNFDQEVDDEEPEGEIVKGELRAETLNYKIHDDDISDMEDDISDRNHWTGPVSPRQLSIRLHEVLQERLEDRIKELESAMSRTQTFSERTLSNSDLDSGPFCLNLSGEGVSAYEEACEEFIQMNNFDDDDDDDDDDDGDYDCDEIIQKIMEKKGSPVVRHAQMMLLSLDV